MHPRRPTRVQMLPQVTQPAEYPIDILQRYHKRVVQKQKWPLLHPQHTEKATVAGCIKDDLLDTDQ